MINSECNNIELAVLNFFLQKKGFELLDKTAKLVIDRELTGVGSFTDFVFDDCLKVGKKNQNYIYREIFAVLNDKFDTGYLLTVSSGYITFLECYTHEEKWPDEIEKISFYEIE